mmetsp:Transcript_51862/g.97186  ORF Transcript_51862/g.97186 Transcript_51862/m.97186 type:complete len:394 (-) Transcript_51862:4-1185(-)
MAHPLVSIRILTTILASTVRISVGISSARGDAGEQQGDADLSSRRSSLVRRESGAIELDQSGTQMDAAASPHKPHSCTYFDALRGQASCPNKQWVEAMVKADPSPGKIILDVGCGRGNNAIKWLELYDLSPTPLWNLKNWRTFFKDSLAINQTENCSALPPQTLARHHHPDAYQSARVFPRVICIESDPAKIDVMRQASSVLGYGDASSFGSLEFVHAFITEMNKLSVNATANSTTNQASANMNQNVYGPSQPPYNTNLKSAPATIEVPRKTVDGVVHELELPRVDILTMDLDGTDPDVLLGAEKTLAAARYIEFEVHRSRPNTTWIDTKLHTVVTDLDSKGFECFFAGNRGRLMPIQKCWKEEFEKVAGAKVACVKQGDLWATPLGKFSGVW